MIDFGVELQVPGGDKGAINESLAIVETKTADGEGRADRMLKDEDLAPVSLSKYRLGIGLVVLPQEDRDYARRLQGEFRVG